MLRILLLFCLSSSALAQSAFEQAKPWLGVAIEKGAQGVLIKDIIAGTPAEGAGLKPGDQITAVDADAVREPGELIKAVQAKGVGTTVTVHFLRAGKPAKESIKLVARPDQLALLQAQLVGKPAPAFSLKRTFGNGPEDSAKLQGHVTIVEFWATWCPACRSTHAKLSRFAKAHKGHIHVLAISDEDEPTLKAYATQVHPEFTILQDKDHAATKGWMVSAIPELAVIDQSGKVTFVTIGAGEYLDETLQRAEKLAGK